jgi:hypothetical protein
VESDNLPRWDGRRGRYEVWFLTLNHGQIGYWIRYTLRAPVAGPAERTTWFARFDPDHPARTFGVHGTPEGDPAPGYFGVGGTVLGPGAARGRIAGRAHQASWDLRWEPGQPTVRILPPAFYRTGLAPTKPFTPNPDVRFGGTIEADGERVDLDGAAGQQGHLYGTHHAERWAWACCNRFAGDGWAFQALSAQGLRGPFLNPFLTFAGLRIDGRWVRFRGTSGRRTWALGVWRLRLKAKAYRLEGEVGVRPEHLIRARYLDPDDTPRFCHNSEVASARLVLWEPRPGGWQEAAGLVSEGTTHAEWAGRTPAPGVEAVHEEVA